VAAAGNDARSFERQWPATRSEVLTATAIGSFDAEPGGLAIPEGDCIESLLPDVPVDDAPAFFSNFATSPEGERHTVAAPGICVTSTDLGDWYARDSGTSLATPLVSGVVALCIASGKCAGLTPQQIVAKIVADAAAYNTARGNQDYGYTGDPLRPIPGKYYGYLIRAALY
jgi:subtilisin family serine protease